MVWAAETVFGCADVHREPLLEVRKEVGMMGIERALTLPGWMTAEELTYIADIASRSKVVVELGSWRGRSAVCWAENLPPDGRLYCIDTWDDAAFGCESFPGDTPEMKSKSNWLMENFLFNTSHVAEKIHTMRRTTIDGLSFLDSMGIKADVVFIDAGHLAHEVEADILAAYPLLKEGGILMGHDYGYSGWPDVKTVVDRMIPQFRVIGTIWTTEAEK